LTPRQEVRGQNGNTAIQVDTEGWKAKIKRICDSSLRYQRNIQLVKSGAVIDIVGFLIKYIVSIVKLIYWN
jgi:hypothetical protein